MTQAQAQQYYPIAFLGQTVPLSSFNTVANWDPTAAIAAHVNAFVPSSNSTTVASGSSVTLVMKPQTPGLGAVSNGVYTIPTGTYTLTDIYNGSSSTLASGSLDAAGEASLTATTLGVGTHRITMAYSGDSNFSASTTSTPYILNIAASGATTPLISIQPAPNAIYGSASSVTATVSGIVAFAGASSSNPSENTGRTSRHPGGRVMSWYVTMSVEPFAASPAIVSC